MSTFKAFETATGSDWWNDRRVAASALFTRGIRVPNKQENEAALRGSLLHAIFLMSQFRDTIPGLEDTFHPLFPRPDVLETTTSEFCYLWDLIQLDVERQATNQAATTDARASARHNVHAAERRRWSNSQGVFDLGDSNGVSFHWPYAADRLDHLVDSKGRGAAEVANRALLWDNQTHNWLYPAEELHPDFSARVNAYRNWYHDMRERQDSRLDLTSRRLEFYEKRDRPAAPPPLGKHCELDSAVGLVGEGNFGFDLKTGKQPVREAIQQNRAAAERLAAHYATPVRILVLTWTAEACRLTRSKEVFQPGHSDKYPHVREVRYHNEAWEHAWHTRAS